MDKSSDFTNFINPWIYLSTINLHLHILYLGVDITVAILHYTQLMAGGMSGFAEVFWSLGTKSMDFLINPWLKTHFPLLAHLRVFILSGCYIFNHAESLARLVYLIVKLDWAKWSFSICIYFLFSQKTITDLRVYSL